MHPEPPPPPEAVVAALRAAGCVFAEEEAALIVAAAPAPADAAVLVARRVAGEPLEHVLGWAEFCGLRVEVGPGVFVPRRRTEAVVRAAVAAATPGAVVLDLCCGSGAIGLAVVAALGSGRLVATDVEPAAVAYARRNVARVGGTALLGDLDAAVPRELEGEVDVLVANAPYVPTAAIPLMPPEARLHEPRVALDGGADGLDVQRRVIAVAPRWLAPRGRLLVETSGAQSAATVAAVTAAGLTALVLRDDDLDATVVVGSRAATG